MGIAHIIFGVLAAGVKYSATMTAGTDGGSPYADVGYLNGSYGSMTSTAIGGRSLDAFNSKVGADIVTLSVSGFSSDPGSGWLKQATWNGHAFTPTSDGGATYSYSGGIATWTWTYNLLVSSGTNYSITLDGRF